MKTVILAGGMGTRLTEETQSKPKPMVEIGGQPILWHIMKHYAAHGFNEFLIALGYRGEAIKRYFVEYPIVRGNVSIDLATGEVARHDSGPENWRVHLIDTGLHTITGGRVKRLRPWIGRETFLLTYGDGVSNVDVSKLVAFHRRHGKLATVTAVRPPARFGGLTLDGDQVQQFTEKPQIGEGWINGGFFVLEPEVLDFIDGDETHLELEPMEQLVRAGELIAFRHDGFWQCMDTIREHRLLESLWAGGSAPWKTWSDGPEAVRFASAA